MATTLAITGIGGFIGSRLAERAITAGFSVRGLDIDEAAARRVEALGATVTVGDIHDGEVLREVFEGADWVIHTAAIVEESGDRDRFVRVNVEGTRSALKFARKAGVKRFLHLSSVMVYGFEYPEGVEEDFEYQRAQNVYCETKQLSDEDALAAHAPGEFEVVVIRPGDVYGPGSTSWVDRPIELMKSGWFNLPEGGRGIINHVHVDNLIDGIFLAIEADATGEAFNITDGQATSALEFFRFHADMVGKRSVPVLPTSLIRGALAVAGPVLRLAGKELPADPEALQFLMRMSKVSTEKARTELGYEPRISLEEGMKEIATRYAGLVSE